MVEASHAVAGHERSACSYAKQNVGEVGELVVLDDQQRPERNILGSLKEWVPPHGQHHGLSENRDGVAERAAAARELNQFLMCGRQHSGGKHLAVLIEFFQ